MAISSAMYAAVTGLSALGTGMQTISNNIANVNTVGFKAGRTNYEDLISQNYFSGGKVNQRGTGVRVSSIQSMFTQGSFMSSAQDTDMAITGEGFFSVRNAVTGAINYTRAGNFTMTKDGELEDPNGNILQGWQMSIPKPGQEAVRIGTPTDVKVTVLNAPPVASSLMKVVANLNAEDDPAYLYQQFELADVYAKSQAEPVAESARIATIAGIYPTTDSPQVSLINEKLDDAGNFANIEADPAIVETSQDDVYDASFLLLYNQRYEPTSAITSLDQLKVIKDTKPAPAKGTLTDTGHDYNTKPATLTGVVGQTSAYTVGNSDYDKNLVELFNKKFNANVQAVGNLTVVLYKNVTKVKTDTNTTGQTGDGKDYKSITPNQSNFEDNFLELYQAAYPNVTLPNNSVGDIKVVDTLGATKPVLSPAGGGTVGNAATLPAGNAYEASFLEQYQKTYGPQAGITDLSMINVYSDEEAAKVAAANGGELNRANGELSLSEYKTLMGGADFLTQAERDDGCITDAEFATFNSRASIVSQAERQLGVMTVDEFNELNDNVSLITLADRSSGLMTKSEFDALREDATGPIAKMNDQAVHIQASLDDSVTTDNDRTDPVKIVSPDKKYNEQFLTSYKNFLKTQGYGDDVLKAITSVHELKVVYTGITPGLTDEDRKNGFLTVAEFTDAKNYADGQGQYVTGIGHFTSEDEYAYSTIKPWPENSNDTYNAYFEKFFIKQYNDYHPGAGVKSMEDFKIVDDSSVLSNLGSSYERQNGFLTKSEFNSLVISARAEARAEATAKGRDAYNNLYNNVYNSTFNSITSRLNDWQLEGNGFAGAWNAQDNPPIKPESYTYPQSLTIYDSLGADHKLNVYYQPNPHMDNVWDYIITCDPTEDARKDSNNNLLMSDSASFSGLIQKGKITFSADGPDRHGGEIKDIEAQNIDLEKCKMATIDPKSYTSAATTTMRNATIGGYYKGSPSIDPYTGVQRTSARTYEVRWGGNVKGDPETSGMVWSDDLGNTGIIPVYDKQFAGPYSFGSGLSITFDTNDLPLRFGEKDKDAITVTAHSEQMAWTNLEPNKEGYFDFDVAFVQSASMALHPPYPEGMPTMIQNIALDMGAKNPYGLATNWELDDQSTTQYAAKSNTIFASSDGYPSGSLQRISIGTDGVLTGVFSNGRNQPLYQIGLTRFLNPWGLSKIGDNLFEETRYSGEGAMNEPGTAGNGTILANFLEQSNVDLSEEIVNMIVTQRGFQANSKTVTTTDTMLSEVIEMKR